MSKAACREGSGHCSTVSVPKISLLKAIVVLHPPFLSSCLRGGAAPSINWASFQASLMRDNGEMWITASCCLQESWLWPCWVKKSLQQKKWSLQPSASVLLHPGTDGQVGRQGLKTTHVGLCSFLRRVPQRAASDHAWSPEFFKRASRTWRNLDRPSVRSLDPRCCEYVMVMYLWDPWRTDIWNQLLHVTRQSVGPSGPLLSGRAYENVTTSHWWEDCLRGLSALIQSMADALACSLMSSCWEVAPCATRKRC